MGFSLSEPKPIQQCVSSKYDSSKKINYIDVMIFKRFSLHRKKLDLVNLWIYSAKTNIFEKLFLNIYTCLGYFILTAAQFNSESLCRPEKRKLTYGSGFSG